MLIYFQWKATLTIYVPSTYQSKCKPFFLPNVGLHKYRNVISMCESRRSSQLIGQNIYELVDRHDDTLFNLLNNVEVRK